MYAVASGLADSCAITTKTLLESVGETGTPSWTRRTVASHITLTIAQVHEPLYRLGASRWKIERALKSANGSSNERPKGATSVQNFYHTMFRSGQAIIVMKHNE